MVQDKILILENSDLLKSFLKERLEPFNFELIFAKDSFDFVIKMKNYKPDLMIIEYSVLLNSSVNILEEKNNYKLAQSIPIIMIARNIEAGNNSYSSKYNIQRFVSKPIKIEVLLKAIEEILNKNLNIDKTQCIIDIHLNDDILFIEVAGGLNKDKIDSIKYKINEIKNLYNIDNPKILLMLVDININEQEVDKLYFLLLNILKYANKNTKAIKILTMSDNIKGLILQNNALSSIEVTNDINTAIDKLSDIKIDDLLNKGWVSKDEEIRLTFSETDSDNKVSEKRYRISVVDDDKYILDIIKTILSSEPALDVSLFSNGNDFIKSLDINIPDLVFLDLMMPQISGFDILEYLKKNSKNIPIIIFSALSQKETVRKTLTYGVKSYIVKPVTPDKILKKTLEVLKSNFY